VKYKNQLTYEQAYEIFAQNLELVTSEKWIAEQRRIQSEKVEGEIPKLEKEIKKKRKQLEKLKNVI